MPLKVIKGSTCQYSIVYAWAFKRIPISQLWGHTDVYIYIMLLGAFWVCSNKGPSIRLRLIGRQQPSPKRRAPFLTGMAPELLARRSAALDVPRYFSSGPKGYISPRRRYIPAWSLWGILFANHYCIESVLKIPRQRFLAHYILYPKGAYRLRGLGSPTYRL